MHDASDPWLVPLGGDGPGHLVCVPYAGGNSAIFRGWGETLRGRAHVYGVELPGRGRRLREPPIADMDHLVSLLAAAVAARISGPYSLFGHSLGGAIAYELARVLADAGSPPQVLFVSAALPPRDTPRAPGGVLKSDAEILQSLARIGGTPPEILENAALMNLLLPALRADFLLADTYAAPGRTPLNTPIVALAGVRDTACSPERMQAWRDHTQSAFALHAFDGGHFFLRERASETLARLCTVLDGHRSPAMHRA